MSQLFTLGLRGTAGGGARVTAGPKRTHLSVCPGLTGVWLGPGMHLLLLLLRLFSRVQLSATSPGPKINHS